MIFTKIWHVILDIKHQYGKLETIQINQQNVLNLVSEKGLIKSFEVIKDIINSFEIGVIPYNTKYCEPHLSKYNLYPTISSKDNYKNNDVKEITDLLSYSDGKLNIFEISSKINLELNKLLKHLKILKKLKLLKTKYL